MKCSKCGTEISAEPVKEWAFKDGYYIVKKVHCQNCNKTILKYYHEGKLKFTIPKNQQNDITELA